MPRAAKGSRPSTRAVKVSLDLELEPTRATARVSGLSGTVHWTTRLTGRHEEWHAQISKCLRDAVGTYRDLRDVISRGRT